MCIFFNSVFVLFEKGFSKRSWIFLMENYFKRTLSKKSCSKNETKMSLKNVLKKCYRKMFLKMRFLQKCSLEDVFEYTVPVWHHRRQGTISSVTRRPPLGPGREAICISSKTTNHGGDADEEFFEPSSFVSFVRKCFGK